MIAMCVPNGLDGADGFIGPDGSSSSAGSSGSDGYTLLKMVVVIAQKELFQTKTTRKGIILV